MKKSARARGEGWLIGAALCLALALSLCAWLNRRPRAVLAAPVHSVSRAELERAARVDLNAADAAELEELPGVGPALAARIVEYRAEHGPFDGVDALDEVPGIGAAKIAALREHAWAAGEAP